VPTPGERAVDRARVEWAFGVSEKSGPHGFARIDEYIRSPDGLGWGWWKGPAGKGYDRNGAFAWCGAFAARCWADETPLSVRREHFASTYRLAEWGRGGGAAAYQEVEIGRPLAWEPAPGDLAVIERGDGGKWWGDHITVVESFHPGVGTFETIEGNATGIGPSDLRYEGVVKRARFLPGRAPEGRKDFVRFLIRPMPADEAVA